jgi:hypothetical protein
MTLIKVSGIFLTLLSSCLNQFLLRLYIEQLYCDRLYEIEGGCDSQLRQVGNYFSVVGFILLLILCLYSDFFVTKQFPDKNIPWAAWNERSRLFRNIYKLI